MTTRRSILSFFALAAVAPLRGFAADSSLELVGTIPLPGVKGRIDHFAVDVKGHRLFVAELGNDTLEVLDTRANRHLKSVEGFGEPQGLLYLADKNILVVANGSANRVDILDGATLSPARHLERLDDADNVRYDAAAHHVVVGYGKGALLMLDSETGDSRGEIPLQGHPESFQLETNGTRIFVNVPTARHIAVADRVKRSVIGTWEVPGARANFPMALDEKNRRLFVGTRVPAAMLVYDIDSGKVVARKMIGEDPDDLFYDAERKRVYVICGTGHVEVFRQESPGQYVFDGSVLTSPRARTGLFVPEEGRLYVAGPASGRWPPQVFVFRAR
jgi:DNA-binding beta-propeller fold protein YncE